MILVKNDILYLFNDFYFKIYNNKYNYKNGCYYPKEKNFFNKLEKNKKIKLVKKENCQLLDKVVGDFNNSILEYNINNKYSKNVEKIRIAKNYIFLQVKDIYFYFNKI